MNNDMMTAALAARSTPGVSNRARTWLAAGEVPAGAPLYLGPWHLRPGPLRDACLLAVAFRRVPQLEGRTVGAVLGRSGLFSGDTARMRLLALTRQPWPAALASLRSVMAVVERGGGGLDFHDLAWVASHWEDPERHFADMRRWARDFTRRGPAETDRTAISNTEPDNLKEQQ